jgi:hypothetical protein
MSGLRFNRIEKASGAAMPAIQEQREGELANV